MDLFFEERKRNTIRMHKHDYAGWGYYFVTIKTQGNRHLFGRIEKGRVVLNDLGQIVQSEWRRTADMRPDVRIDEFVIMPDHFHGILIMNLAKNGNQTDIKYRLSPTGGKIKNQSGSLAAVISGFKSAATSKINKLRGSSQPAIWHRNYYECIIPDARALMSIRRYIRDNPAQWTRRARKGDLRSPV